MRTKIINLIGGPGVGKSTLAAEIFAELKKKGKSAELALEYAKDQVWDENLRILKDQLYIFGKQNHRIWRLYGKVDYIITDSPILLSAIYNQYYGPYFTDMVINVYNEYDNALYLIDRGTEYQEQGRLQNLEQAIQIDNELQTFLDIHEIPYTKVSINNVLDVILKNVENFEKQ